MWITSCWFPGVIFQRFPKADPSAVERKFSKCLTWKDGEGGRARRGKIIPAATAAKGNDRNTEYCGDLSDLEESDSLVTTDDENV